VSQQFFAKLAELSSKREPFAVATVIQTEGSSSARPGSKAIIDSSGRLLSGWVGGGCAEGAVRQAAQACIQDARTCILTLDLTDEVFGTGMPCGGMMKVFIEPVLPSPELVIVGHGRIAEMLAQLGHLVGLRVTVADPGATPGAFPFADRVIASELTSAEVEIGPASYVVIATQHKGDHLSIMKAREGHPAYIALVASPKRSQLVMDYLSAAGAPNDEGAEAPVHAPAGLDIGAQTPEEIALSVISEIVAVRRGASGRPLQEVKGIKVAGAEDADLDRLEQVLNTCGPSNPGRHGTGEGPR
jgi:xanthine dehydrogenase accessory factor